MLSVSGWGLLRTGPEATAPATSAAPSAPGVGPVHVQCRRRLHGHLLPIPTLKAHCRRHAGDEATARCREGHEHAGGAGGADMATLRVDRHFSSHVGVEVTQLVDVTRNVHRADLTDPHRTVGVDETGVYVLAGNVHHASPCGNLYVGADRPDHPVLEQDGTVFNHSVCDGVDRGPS